MIRLITGVCPSPEGLKRPESGPFSLPEKEEAYLVSRKVAEYVREPVATDDADRNEDGEGVDTSEEIAPAPATTVEGKLAVEDLLKMTMSELRRLAAQMEINPEGLKTKQDYAEAISKVEFEVEPEAIITDEMPDLNPEAPVE